MTRQATLNRRDLPTKAEIEGMVARGVISFPNEGDAWREYRKRRNRERMARYRKAHPEWYREQLRRDVLRKHALRDHIVATTG